MKYVRALIQAMIIGFSLSLVACGGGGGSSNPNPTEDNSGGNTGPGGAAGAKSFPNRVTRVDYDYDNNGMLDATDTISYDANGHVTQTSYHYSDDGMPDLLNLRDTGTTQETGTLTYDSAGNITLFVVDRQSERFEVNFTSDASGLPTRLDWRQLNASGGQTAAQYWTFAYTNQRLDTVDNFITATNQLSNSQSFTYGANGLPTTSGFTSSGINATTTFTWRGDGKLEALNTQNDNGAVSNVTLTYNAQGLQQNQDWLNNGSGFSYNAVPGKSYTRSITYDAQNRPATTRYDLDSDGNIDATVTLTWENEPCIPATLWAPNGFPNFIKDDARAFVPGVGFFTTEFCAL